MILSSLKKPEDYYVPEEDDDGPPCKKLKRKIRDNLKMNHCNDYF